MRRRRTRATWILLLIPCLLGTPAAAAPVGTAFTYQGFLEKLGNSVNGAADLRCTLYDAEFGGSQVGPTNTLASVQVDQGVFTVQLDFGTGAFDGNERWLEVEVRHPAGGGGYTVLAPRVEILAVPYAQKSIEGSLALDAHTADAGAHHDKTVDASELVSGTLDDARLSSAVSLLGPSIEVGELAFDTATQAELDVHVVDPSAHHAKTVDASELLSGTLDDARLSSAVSLLGASIEIGELAFDTATEAELTAHAGDASAHHTRYDDTEAVAAVVADDLYVLNTGDTVTGPLTVDPDAGGTALSVTGGTPASGTTSYGIFAVGEGTGFKYGGQFNAGTNTQSGLAYGIRTRALSSNSTQYGAFLEAGLSTVNVEAIGVDARAYGTNINRAGHFVAGESDRGSVSYGIESYAYSSDDTKYGGYFVASAAGTGTGYGVYASGPDYDFYAAGAGVDYGSSSSARWKEDVRPIEEPLEKVNRLRGVRFQWDEEHGGRRDMGMIAEEVGAVVPEIVAFERNGSDAVAMDYGKLTPLLVEAVKALGAENEALRVELAGLRARVERVEGDGRNRP